MPRPNTNFDYPSAKAVTFIGLCAVCAFALISLYVLSLPVYSGGKLTYTDGSSFIFPAPDANTRTVSDTFSLDFTMTVPLLHATKFKCYGEDCITRFLVNGREVPNDGTWDKETGTQVLDFGPHLHIGTNVFHIEIHSKGPYVYFYLRPDISDPYTMFWISSAMALLAIAARRTMRWFPHLAITKLEESIFLFGSLLRILYSLSTAYFVRTYDSQGGHIPYIDVVSVAWALPTSIDQTLEFYQPPAYYFLCAISGLFLRIWGLSLNSAIELWQSESTLLTIATLAACLPVSRILFTPRQVKQQSLFLAFMAIFPTFVYNANSVNNDILFSFISIGWLALFLLLWKRISLKKWILLSMLLGAALLVKANAIPLIVITTLTLMLTRQLGWRRKLALTAIAAVTILALAGWFYVPRALASKSPVNALVSNLHMVPQFLHIQEDVGKLATFDPVAVIENPFSSQSEADQRREFFWEYFFRSALFGENFFFPGSPCLQNGRVITIAVLLLLPLTLFGWIVDLRTPRSLAIPLTILTSMICTVHLIFMLQAPFICCQHFRYSAIIIIPLAYFCIQGLMRLPKWLQALVYLDFTVMLVAWIIFLFALFRS